MNPATVDAILDGIGGNWHVPDGIEITMEANPSSVEANAFAAIAPPASTAFRSASRR